MKIHQLMFSSFNIIATENLKEYIVKRSVPVEYDGRKIEIKNIEVLENGEKVDYKINRKDRNVVIKLNNKNQELSVGKHTYNIKYRIDNLIENKKVLVILSGICLVILGNTI